MTIIDCWDLDDTILNKARLFGPTVRIVAERLQVSEQSVWASLARVGRSTFTFQAWLGDLGLPSATSVPLERELRSKLEPRAKDSCYPGVPELIRKRQRQGIRQVLITAGDPSFQRWKFGLLGLMNIFAVADQHFIQLQPKRGSKAEIVTRYRALGSVNLVDDNVDWLNEVADAAPLVKLIRPCWPGATHTEPHEYDGQRWLVVRSIGELQHALED